MSWKSKTAAAKPKKTYVGKAKDPEEEREFDELRRKYAYAIGFLLVNNVEQSKLKDYFDDEQNLKRYECLKKFRQDIIDKRPKAKQWVDKGFYVGIKVGDSEVSDQGTKTQLKVNDSIFSNRTQVVSNRYELDQYMETVARIIDSEKLWSDPTMQLFSMPGQDASCLIINKKYPLPKKGLDEIVQIYDEDLVLESPTENLALQRSD